MLKRYFSSPPPPVPSPLPEPAPPPPPSRRDMLLALFDARGHGLEIGAGFNPLLPKAQGYDVKTLDHASADDLRLKYRDAQVDGQRVEEVDYVCTDGSLVNAVGATGCFDFIAASHVIEHTPDPLRFLRECEALLAPGGVLVLAVPDKRYSFDTLRPACTAGAMLQAFLEKRARHTPGQLFDEVAYNSVRGGALAWHPGADGELAFAASLQAAASLFEAHAGDGNYRDIHGWQFTPSGFRLALRDLHEIGYVGLKEDRFAPNGSEFFVTLTRTGSPMIEPRMELAQRAIAEAGASR